MKLKQIFVTKPFKMKKVKEAAEGKCGGTVAEEEELMTAEEIESTLDDIQNEFGNKFNKQISQITNSLSKKDLAAATREMEKLMDKVRKSTEG